MFWLDGKDKVRTMLVHVVLNLKFVKLSIGTNFPDVSHLWSCSSELIDNLKKENLVSFHLAHIVKASKALSKNQ